MKRSFRVLLAAVAVLAALCSGAWAAKINVDPGPISSGAHNDEETWKPGTYTLAAGQTATFTERITISGYVELVLEDGCTLNAEKGITVASGDALTINGGPEGNGKLVATMSSNNDAAIGGIGITKRDAGKITINGGVVTAQKTTTGSTSAAIGGGDDGSGGEITINGGVVTAMNDQDDSTGAAIGSGQSNGETVSGGVIKITGGVVTARARDGAAIGGGGAEPLGGTSTNISGGTIIMTGGIIEATSENGDGIGYGVKSSGPDRGTLSSDLGGRAWIVASSIPAKSADVFKSGVAFNGANGQVYGDVTISGDVVIPSGKKLTAPGGTKLTVPANASMAMSADSSLTIDRNATLTIEADAKFDAEKGTIVNNGSIVNKGEMAMDSGSTLTVEQGATLTIEADATFDAEDGTIVNRGTIINNGEVKLAEGTDIAALGITGTGTIEMGGVIYDNEGNPTGGGDVPIHDEPASVDKYIDTEELTALPDSDKINTEGTSETIKDVDAVIVAAPILADVVEKDKTPYGTVPTVSADVAVDLATSFLIEEGIIDPDGSVSADAITRMPIKTVDVTPDKPDAIIIFADLRSKDLTSVHSSVRVEDIVVLKVKSADSALPVPAALEPGGSDFANGSFMITDADNKPVTTIDPNGGPYNLLVRVTDLTEEASIDDPSNFDVNTDPGKVVDPIIIVRDAKGTNSGSSGGACSAGAAAFVALAALAMIKRRTR